MRRAQAPPHAWRPCPPYHVSLDGVVAVVQFGQVLEVVELAEHHLLLGRVCGEWEQARQPGPVLPTPGPPEPWRWRRRSAVPRQRKSRRAKPTKAGHLSGSLPGGGLAWERLITSTQTGQGPLAGRVGTHQERSRSPHTFSLPILPPRSPHPWPEQKVPPHTRARWFSNYTHGSGRS